MAYALTHSEYVILVAYLRQQGLSEHTSMLRYMYIASLVYLTAFFVLRTDYKLQDMEYKRNLLG